MCLTGARQGGRFSRNAETPSRPSALPRECGDAAGRLRHDVSSTPWPRHVADQALGLGLRHRTALQQHVQLPLNASVERLRLHHLVRQPDFSRLLGRNAFGGEKDSAAACRAPIARRT